jgi:hypothetical protein
MECKMCGKSGNVSGFCSNVCKREHHEKVVNAMSLLEKWFESNFKEPELKDDLIKRVLKEVNFGFKVSNRLVSLIIHELCTGTNLKTYPEGSNPIKVVYWKQDHEKAIFIRNVRFKEWINNQPSYVWYVIKKQNKTSGHDEGDRIKGDYWLCSNCNFIEKSQRTPFSCPNCKHTKAYGAKFTKIKTTHNEMLRHNQLSGN